MASQDLKANRDYTVLVTGFGPFLGNVPVTAGMIAKLLPEVLPGGHAMNPTGRTITILSGPKADYAAMPTELGAIRTRIKDLHAEYASKVDVWLHLAQFRQNFIACNRRAFGQGFSSTWDEHSKTKPYYLTPDSAGQTIEDLGPSPWSDKVPMGLESELPIDETVNGANRLLQADVGAGGDSAPLEVRAQNECGGHGGGFCYYESMANCFVEGRKRNVLCVNVPPGYHQTALEKSRDHVLAVIGASIAAFINHGASGYEDEK